MSPPTAFAASGLSPQSIVAGAASTVFFGVSSRRPTLSWRARRRRSAAAVVRKSASKEPEEDVFDERAARAAEISEVIEGLQQFRQRIVDDVKAAGKKVRAPTKQVNEALQKHADILKIDQSIIDLEAELKLLE